MTPSDITTQRLLAALSPARHPGTYVFACLTSDAAIDPDSCVSVMHEPEGPSIIAAADKLPADARPIDYPASWITLGVNSTLDGVGLTAAVATQLMHAGISCNVVAGARHDHLFVPVAEAEHAMDLLLTLQRDARESLAPSAPII